VARWYSFAVARVAAHPARDERLNVGLVVLDGERLDIRPARNLDKIRALSAALESGAVRQSLLNLESLDNTISSGSSDAAERLDVLRTMSAFEFTDLGRFEAHSASAYESAVASLLLRLVEPEPAPMKKAVRRSRLLSSLKAAFKTERVMAKRGEDLSAHRVVAGWPLAEGLSADLVLKNGSMHVIETVDAQSDDVSLRKIISDIAVSALVLEQARMTFGADETNARLVYSASPAHEDIAKPSLRAAEHQGTELINWASHDDRRRFITDITKLAVPADPPSKSKGLNINASTQGRFSLN